MLACVINRWVKSTEWLYARGVNRGRGGKMKVRKLPASYAFWVMPQVLSAMMSGVVSFIATLKSVGVVPNIVALWLGAWQVSFLIAFPTLMLVLPVVRRLVALVDEQPDPPQ
jgi:hypothetical protein